MHKIRLAADVVFATNCVVSVYDVTEDAEKKRCKITVEYAASDVRRLKERSDEEGSRLTMDGALDYYRKWIYRIVHHYIADDWQCMGGLEEIMAVVEEHIKRYY